VVLFSSSLCAQYLLLFAPQQFGTRRRREEDRRTRMGRPGLFSDGKEGKEKRRDSAQAKKTNITAPTSTNPFSIPCLSCRTATTLHKSPSNVFSFPPSST